MQPPHPSSARDSSTDALALHDAAAALDPPTRAALGVALQHGRLTRLQVAQAWVSCDRSGPAFVRWVGERLAPTAAETVVHGTSSGSRPALPATASAGVAERIGPYVVERELARGGMGVVYVATHAQLGRRVALKLLPSGARDEDQERFQLEAQAAARLKHPNIVGVHDVGVEKGQPWIAMDLIDGESLHGRLGRDGPMEEEEAAELVEKVSRAMAYAHKAGLLHRDIKPHNVLLDREGEPFLADFGVAKDVRRAARGVTVTGQVIGTPAYMPPEQAAGDLELVDRRSDVYSLGATLYHALTGRLPFDGPTPVNVITKVLTTDVVRPSALRRGLDRDLETVCLHAMEKDPAQRYPTAQALAEDLKRWRTGVPISARPVGALERAWRRVRRNRGLTGAALAVLGVVIAGWAVMTFRLERLRRIANNQRQLAIEQRAAAEDARQLAVEAGRKTLAAAEEERRAKHELEARQLLSSGYTLLSLGRHADAFEPFEEARKKGAALDTPVGEVLAGAAERGKREAQANLGTTAGGEALVAAFAPEGGLLAAFEGDRVVVRQGDDVRWTSAAGPATTAFLAFFGRGDELGLVAAWTENDRGRVAAWDVRTGRERWRKDATPGPVTGLAVDSTGQRVVLGDQRATLLVLQTSGGGQPARLTRPRAPAQGCAVYGLSFVPVGGGQQVLVASYDDGVLGVVDFEGSRFLLPNLQTIYASLVAAPPGTFGDAPTFIGGDQEGNVSVLILEGPDLSPREVRRLLSGQAGQIRSVAVSARAHDGDVLVAATCEDGSLWVWDQRGELRQRVHVGGHVGACTFSADARLVAAGCPAPPRVWSAGARRMNGHAPVAFSWESDELFVCRRASREDPQVALHVVARDLKDEQQDRGLPIPKEHPIGAVKVWALAPTRSGLLVSVMEHDNELVQGRRELWTWQPGATPRAPMKLRVAATALAVTPDGERALLGSHVDPDTDPSRDQGRLGEVLPLSLADGRAGTPHDWHAATVSWLQAFDERRFLSASDDGTVALWDLDRPEPLRLLDGRTGQALAWSAAASRGRNRRDFEGLVRAASFSPRLGAVAVGNAQGRVRLWKEQGGAWGPDLRGHEHQLVLCAFLPDGERLVTASSDGVLRVWDVPLAAVLRTIQLPQPLLLGAALSRDGRRVALASSDGVWVYDLAE